MLKDYQLKDYEKFFNYIFDKPKHVLYESDIAFNDGRGNEQIYYTNDIFNLLHIKVVKRMSRIFQLGNKILKKESLMHTRLEHSKGTYFRTLKMLMHICESPEISNLIEEKHLKKYLIAELIRALLHDLGHGPFSHTLETVCRLPKGFHEIIGKRMIREDDELRNALEKIYPNLPELLDEVEEKNFLGLNCLFEGQFDVDRADFVLRDLLFFSASGEKGLNENDDTRRIIDELLQNFELKQISDNGVKRIVPVFANNQMDNIAKFLKIRNDSYRNIYYSSYGKRLEHIFRKFADEVISSDEEYDLKKYFKSLYKADPYKVDLQLYAKFNDIDFFRGIIEIYNKTKNDRLRQLAMCCLPNYETVRSIYYGAMVSPEQVDEEGMPSLSDEDIKLLSDFEEIRNSIGNEDFSDKYFKTVKVKSEKEVERIINMTKPITGARDSEELDRQGIFFDISKNASYKNKKGEEIYVEGKDGEVYEYSVHPERTEPIETFDNCIIVLDFNQMSRTLSEEECEKIDLIMNSQVKEIA